MGEPQFNPQMPFNCHDTFSRYPIIRNHDSGNGANGFSVQRSIVCRNKISPKLPGNCRGVSANRQSVVVFGHSVELQLTVKVDRLNVTDSKNPNSRLFEQNFAALVSAGTVVLEMAFCFVEVKKSKQNRMRVGIKIYHSGGAPIDGEGDRLCRAA